MSNSDHDDRATQLQHLRHQVTQLEAELEEQLHPWQAESYYSAYHATSGFVLGMIGAAVSLLANVVGSALINQNPLRLIQVYLTFPLGESILKDPHDSGMLLALGCCLYLATGMILGIPFQMAIARWLPRGTLVQRLLFGTLAGLVLWIVNFYFILVWLQPLLFGGNWITDPQLLPPWVALGTHLVFAWVMALLQPWSAYTPYHPQIEQFQTPST